MFTITNNGQSLSIDDLYVVGTKIYGKLVTDLTPAQIKTAFPTATISFGGDSWTWESDLAEFKTTVTNEPYWTEDGYFVDGVIPVSFGTLQNTQNYPSFYRSTQLGAAAIHDIIVAERNPFDESMICVGWVTFNSPYYTYRVFRYTQSQVNGSLTFNGMCEIFVNMTNSIHCPSICFQSATNIIAMINTPGTGVTIRRITSSNMSINKTWDYANYINNNARSIKSFTAGDGTSVMGCFVFDGNQRAIYFSIVGDSLYTNLLGDDLYAMDIMAVKNTKNVIILTRTPGATYLFRYGVQSIGGISFLGATTPTSFNYSNNYQRTAMAKSIDGKKGAVAILDNSVEANQIYIATFTFDIGTTSPFVSNISAQITKTIKANQVSIVFDRNSTANQYTYGIYFSNGTTNNPTVWSCSTNFGSANVTDGGTTVSTYQAFQGIAVEQPTLSGDYGAYFCGNTSLAMAAYNIRTRIPDSSYHFHNGTAWTSTQTIPATTNMLVRLNNTTAFSAPTVGTLGITRPTTVTGAITTSLSGNTYLKNQYQIGTGPITDNESQTVLSADSAYGANTIKVRTCAVKNTRQINSRWSTVKNYTIGKITTDATFDDYVLDRANKKLTLDITQEAVVEDATLNYRYKINTGSYIVAGRTADTLSANIDYITGANISLSAVATDTFGDFAGSSKDLSYTFGNKPANLSPIKYDYNGTSDNLEIDVNPITLNHTVFDNYEFMYIIDGVESSILNATNLATQIRVNGLPKGQSITLKVRIKGHDTWDDITGDWLQLAQPFTLGLFKKEIGYLK